MADENPYLPLVEKEAEQGVRASMLTAIDKQPDTEAKLQDLARRYSMPVEAVRLNQPEVQRRAAFEAVDYETLAREMPGTAAWLSTPENAAIGHDNVENMGAIERKLRQFGGGIGEAVGMSVSGTGVLANVLQRTAVNDFASIFLPEPQRGPMGLEPQKPTIESLAGPLIGEGFQGAGGAVKDFSRNQVAGVGEKTFADQVAGGLGQVVGQIAMLPLARGMGLYAQGADVMAEKVANDKADQRTKDLAVLGGAAITGATEAWALDKLLGPLAVPVKSQIGAALARIGIASAAEGGQEFSENVLQDVVRKALTNRDAEIDVGQSIEEGGVGAVVGGVVRTIVESAFHIKARGDRKAQQADQGAQAVTELADLAKNDKLLQRNPAAFEAFIKQAAEDGPVPTVYIDAQALMQSGVADQVAGVSASVAEQLETALQTGGQIAIPVEEFTAKIAPTDFAQSLIDHIRTEPDGFTRIEAQQYMQSQGEQLQAEVERTLAEQQGNATFQQSQETVKAAIQTELDALGRFDPAKNEADATLFASYYAVRAAQLGVTPEALYQRRGLRFAAEALGGQQFDQAAIETPEFANWFGDSKVVDSAGKPLVVYHGTNADIESFSFENFGRTDGGWLGRGIYFATNAGEASTYAELADKTGRRRDATVYPVYLEMKNPMIWQLGTPEGRALQDKRNELGPQGFSDWLQSQGHDGIWLRGKSIGGQRGEDQLMVFRPEQIKSATGNRGTFDPNDPNILHQGGTINRMTEDQAIAAGFTMKAYRGVSKSSPFNDTGTTWLTTSREVAEAYAEEVMGYDDPGVIEVMVNPSDLKRHDASRLTDEQREQMQADEFGNPQALGIYERSDDHPLGGSRRNVTVIHAPVSAIAVIDGGEYNQGARGAFSPESLTITLLKGADLTTALHEGAHFFFENDIALAAELVSDNAGFGADTMSEGERQIVGDVSALLTWHGYTGTVQEQLAQWYSLDFEQKRTAHERTAESFEAYLFEGRAPSLELAPYFQKFRAWMLSVYKSLKQFLALNPEAGKLDDTVRQVFDRMLATSEQIKLAEQGRSMVPLFATPEEAGMSVDDFAAYQSGSTQATADAIDDLQARGLRDLQWIRNARGREIKKLQKQSASLRAEARIEARRSIMSQPVYQAWQFLTGRLSGGDKAALKVDAPKSSKSVNPETDSLFQAIAKLGGLDRAGVERAWGWDAKERSPQPAFGQPLLRRQNGLSIDAMAELLAENGYLSSVDGSTDYLAEFEDRFSAEYRGDPQYAIAYDYSRAAERRAGDGVDLDVLTSGRLELVALKDMGLPPTIPEFLEGLGMTARDGLHPDLVAERFGFASGDEMVRSLAAAEKPKEAIEAMTDRLMMERHGELSTPDAIERAADAAIHNAARARMVATEANAMAQAAGQRKVLLSAAREFARNVVARVAVKNLKPGQYTNAAARAAANALKASKAGDMETATAEKRNQLVQTMAAREAFDAKTEVDGLRRAWATLANRSDEKLKKTYDMDLVNAVRAILANVGIAESKGKRAAEYLDKLQNYDPTMYAVISQSVTAAEAMGKPFQEMTIEEVRGLADEIEAILHLARRSRQMEVAGNLLDREEIEAELQARMGEIGVPENLPGRTSAITPGEQRLIAFKTLLSSARRVESWVGSMDGSDQMGPFRRFVFGVVKDAADRYRTDKAKYLQQFRGLFDAVAPTLKPQLIHSPELGYTFGKDAGGSAINEILHAILHTGNASNKRKLLLGRGWAVERETGELDTSRWDAFIGRLATEGTLKKEHFDFAQGVWDMLESIKPLAQKTHRDVFGKYFDEVTAEPVQTPFGVYAGGYVPAMADSRVVTDAKLRKLKEDENAGMSYAFPTTPTGFTKARVEYNRPLMLDLRTLAQHIDKVLLFAHMTGPVRDVQKVLTGIGGTLDKLDQGAIEGMLLPWLNRSARQQVTSPLTADGGASRFFSVLRSRAGMAAMFANVVNTAQQITGFSIAAVKVKPRLMLSAAADMAKGPRAFVRAVTEASPYMAGRLDNEVAAMSDQINDILLNPSLLKQGERWTSKHAYFLQSAVDSWMSPIVWKGAYDQAMEAGAEHDDAVRLGDSAVRETQGSSLPEDVSRIETGGAFVRLFTQFAGYFNMQANLMGTEFVKVARDMGLKNGAGRGLYVLFLAFLAPAVVSEMIVQVARGGPEDDDDDGYLDDWLAALFVYAPMRNATAMVPGVGQGINAVVNATNGKPYDDRLATSPAISMLEAAARAPYSAYRALAEDGSAQKAVRDVGTLISMSVGLPASAAARPLGYLAGVEDGRIDPAGPADMARGLITGSRGQP